MGRVGDKSFQQSAPTVMWRARDAWAGPGQLSRRAGPNLTRARGHQACPSTSSCEAIPELLDILPDKRVSVDLRAGARQTVCAHSVAVYTPGSLGPCGVKADLWGWSLSS